MDDEQHMLFDCEAFHELRSNPLVQQIVQHSNGSVRHLSEDPNFYVVCRYIADCMQIVDAQAHSAEQPSSG